MVGGRGGGVRAASRRFLDSLRVHVRSGNGGAGCPSFGGVGGDGGSVVFVGKDGVTLSKLSDRHPDRRFVAGHGLASARRALIGRRGRDLLLSVPTGVELLTDDKRLIGRIDKPGQRIVVAKGGRGGQKLNRYLGDSGVSRSVRLDLKLIADYGFVGFPNAGKSTLMSALSKHCPKVSSYPFTTLRPSVGVIEFGDERRVSLADLPGLVEGSHANVGLGHHFLKHVERTSCLLFVLDVFGFRLNNNYPWRNCLQTAALLNRELELYSPELVNKPAIVVLNKIDKSGGRDCANECQSRLIDYRDSVQRLPEEIRPIRPIEFKEIVQVSAKSRINTDYLRVRLRHWLDRLAEERLGEQLAKTEGQLKRQVAMEAKEAVDSFV